MNKVKSTSALKVRFPKLLVVPYAYAAALVVLAVVTLMGVGGFDFASISYYTPGLPVLAVTTAGLQIFALPFLLRLPLSPLARFFSAIFVIMAPLFLLANISYLMGAGVLETNYASIGATIALSGFGLASFAVLDGPRALRLSRKK